MARRKERARFVRITGGTFRGVRLRYPDGEFCRPTMGRVKEAVLSSIAASLPGAVVLDLYSAAGSMGVEVLSRGGRFAHFVESDRRALAFLRDNLEQLRVPPDAYRIHARDVSTFLADDLAGCSPPPSIVYADAPYRSGGAEMVLAHFAANPYAGLELVVIEHDRAGLPESAGALRRHRHKRFGDSAVSFYSPMEER